jgi:hypothetical protein
MSADELRRLLNAVPFRPFTVYLPSEKTFSVPHSDFASLAPNGRTLIIWLQNSGAFDILDVPLITRLEVEAEHGAEP